MNKIIVLLWIYNKTIMEDCSSIMDLALTTEIITESNKDIQVGTWMLLKLTYEKICANCYCLKTPQWRVGFAVEIEHWYNHKKTKESIQTCLCNACGLKFVNGKYCQICYKIYGTNLVKANPDLYVECSVCKHINHKHCLDFLDLQIIGKKIYVCSNCCYN